MHVEVEGVSIFFDGYKIAAGPNRLDVEVTLYPLFRLGLGELALADQVVLLFDKVQVLFGDTSEIAVNSRAQQSLCSAMYILFCPGQFGLSIVHQRTPHQVVVEQEKYAESQKNKRNKIEKDV